MPLLFYPPGKPQNVPKLNFPHKNDPAKELRFFVSYITNKLTLFIVAVA